MALWSRKKTDEYDREQILDAGAKHERKGNREKAIAEYRKVLKWEPQNLVLQARMAVLLAETGQVAEAWNGFVAAADGHVRDGFVEKGIAVYVQAAAYFPRKVEVWESLARLYVARGRKPDAVKACLDGRRNFRKTKLHQQAVQLLRKAVEIEPFHLEATLDLARLRARTGNRDEARRLLQGIAARNEGRSLRRVRAAQFRLAPTPSAAWRWLRAAIRGS